MTEKNIVLIGMSGCGKTTLGQMLAKKLNMDFIDTDEVIEKEQKRTIKNIFETDGEIYFRNLETECAKKVSLYNNTIISTGGGIILKEENMKYLKENAITFYIKRSVKSIKSTIDASNRPLLSKNLEKLSEMERLRTPLYEKYADFIIVNQKTPQEAIDEMLKCIKNNI